MPLFDRISLKQQITQREQKVNDLKYENEHGNGKKAENSNLGRAEGRLECLRESQRENPLITVEEWGDG